MSSFTVGLGILGGLTLAVVVGYNAWTHRKHAPKRADAPVEPLIPNLIIPRLLDPDPEPPPPPPKPVQPQPPFDESEPPTPPPAFADTEPMMGAVGDAVVTPGAPIEPTLTPSEPVAVDDDASAAHDVPAEASTAAAEATEPASYSEPLDVSSNSAQLPMVAPERRLPLDVLIDALAPIALDGVVSGDAALAAMPPTRRVGSKPFAIEGQNADTQAWEMPRPGQRYTAFQAGLQLANRSGPLNEIEFSEFVVKAQAFADAVSGAPEFPDMLHEVARGRELDQFANPLDAQLGFSLRARSAAWSPGYVQQNAARLGFVVGSIPGRMVLPGALEGAPPLLSLLFDPQAALAEDPDEAALREVQLSLDVPHVPRQEQPFARMCEAAIALAKIMDGVVTDDAGVPIRGEAMDMIARDLEQLYDALDARDLSAGSPQARRLFS